MALFFNNAVRVELLNVLKKTTSSDDGSWDEEDSGESDAVMNPEEEAASIDLVSNASSESVYLGSE